MNSWANFFYKTVYRGLPSRYPAWEKPFTRAGFGFAEAEAGRIVQPDSLFRIASLSKPITAVAILKLVEQSKLALDDFVFDILDPHEWLPSGADARLRRITIMHLLQHTAGWDRDQSFDPITRPRAIAKQFNKPLPVGAADVLRYTLTLPLDFDPGMQFAYSNVGYLLLGRLIERVCGISYETYVREKVLSPMGITRMKLGRAWIGEMTLDEVRYYDSKHRVAAAMNGPRLEVDVPFVYGAENFEAYKAHGGWIASAIDLVRFAAELDNPHTSKLLSAKSIATMFERPTGPAGLEPSGALKAVYYGCGWMVRPVEGGSGANAWHSGLIAGTSSLLVRRHDGFNWAVLFNTDSNPSGQALASLIDPLIHRAIDDVPQWPNN